MTQILIVYNNDPSVSLHDFFELCGDEVKQYCYDYHVNCTLIVPPEMTENIVMQAMESHQVCFIAAHGYFDSICTAIIPFCITNCFPYTHSIRNCDFSQFSCPVPAF